MKAYKGFNKHKDGTLWCRDFQYEVGKTYIFDGEPVLCRKGFHACHELWQCWPFYPHNGENVYYEVECSGEIIERDDSVGKFVCTEITLVREIPAPENKVDDCWDFSDGYAVVKLDGKYNHINTDGIYVSEQWFDGCWGFYDGYAKVWLNDKWNLINTDGKLISEQWFDSCWDFQNGYAIVELDNKYNLINTEGKLLSEQWFDGCWGFYDGYAKVWLNGKCYKIDKSGKITE